MIKMRICILNPSLTYDIHTNSFILPVHFIRIITSTKEMFKLNISQKSNLNPLTLYKEIDNIIEDVKSNKTMISNKLFEIAIKWYLNPVDIIKNMIY